jgi:outer membrane protein assembly factor BamB
MRDRVTASILLPLLLLLTGCGGNMKQAAWTFSAGYQWAEVAVGDDGTVYCAGEDGFVYALTPEGDELWHYDTTARISSGPVLGPNDTLYVFNGESKLVAVSTQGKLKWKRRLECSGGRTGSITAVGDRVYVSTLFRNLYALTTQGELLWAKAWDAGVSRKVLAHDSRIYVGAGGRNNAPHHHLYCLGEDGSEIWAHDAGCSVNTSPVLLETGAIAFGTDEGLMAVDETGELQWRSLQERAISRDPVARADGTIVCVTGDSIYALSNSGQDVWQLDISSFGKRMANAYALAVSGNGQIYTGIGNSLIAVAPEGKLVWVYRYGRDYRKSLECAPAVGNGMVYAVSWDGVLHAVPID